MYVQRLLQINVATLAALGTLLLGMGQRSPGLPLLTMIAAGGSVWLTDFTGWFRLNRKVANLAALAAMAVSIRQLWYYTGDVRVLGIAPMLVYLQMVLLFQQKDRRVYRQLLVLSLLQVVVAAAFSQGFWFGLMLVVYMLVGFWALALLLLHGQSTQYRPAPEAVRASAAVSRWPLDDLQPGFAGTAGGPSRAAVCGELFGRLAAMGLGTLALTVLLFFTVPRLGSSAWRGANVAPRRVVGFSDRVYLGEMGEILQSYQEVMRLELIDPETGRHYPRQPEIYVRGAILTHYVSNDQVRGIWQRPAEDTASPRPLPETDHAAAGRSPLVQRITIEPLDRDELFCVWPLTKTENTPRLWRQGDRLLRPIEYRGRRFQIELGTTAFARGVQAEIVPLSPWEKPQQADRLLQVADLPRLADVAEGWMVEDRPPPGDRIARARVLQRKFHDPDLFGYSLEGQPREAGIDPIEDFVTNNPQGHCEYFATALALMLRTQRIPARVVVGYKCDEFDELGSFYQVRQLHAHTWVEAYLRPEDLPRQLLADRPGQFNRGGWLRLEPTPSGAGAASGPAGRSAVGQIERAFHWLESLWADYVMEMDRRRQQKAVYEPLVRFVKDLARRLTDPQWWRGLLGEIARAMDVRQWSGRYWLWFATIVLLGLPALWFCGRRAWRMARRAWARLWGRTARAAGSGPTEVEFYGRMEALLARHGLVRAAGQTQREFATAAGARIAEITALRQLADLPPAVAEAYYRVRFGRRPLDTHRRKAVEHALAQLAACGFAKKPHPHTAGTNP